MSIVIGALIGILVLLCIFLVLIILMQKSKQEAGLGAAFGGAATEQLFGAGTTSVLTKATIWGTAMFFVITLILAMYYSHEHKQSRTSRILESIGTNQVETISAAPSTNEPVEAVAASATNAVAVATTNAANAVATNTPPALTETNSPASK